MPEVLSPSSGNSISAATILWENNACNNSARAVILIFFAQHNLILWYTSLAKTIMDFNELIKMRPLVVGRLADILYLNIESKIRQLNQQLVSYQLTL